MRKDPPHKTAHGIMGRPRLPAPLPPGELPDENSRIWSYPPAAIRHGEAHIQPDTREWFRQKDGVVAICRFYPDHPRWNLGADKKSNILNDQICGEVHMLARIEAGLPELPKVAIRQMEVKQVQADTAFRLVSAVRKVSTSERLTDTLERLADRQPGQYLKLVRDLARSTYLPAGVEPVQHAPDSKQLDLIIEALGDELRRREQEMKIITVNPQDAEFADPAGAFVTRAMVLHDAANITEDRKPGLVAPDDSRAVTGLRGVVDVNAEDYDDGW